MAEYVFGDIHGSFDTLMALLEKLKVTNDDWLIPDGDLVDRGKNIKAVLDFFLNREKTFIILGNHDFHFIDWFTPNGQNRNAFMYHQGLSDTLEQLGDEAATYAALLKQKGRYVLYHSAKKYVICHADYNWDGLGFDPNIHLWNRIDGQSLRKYEGPIIVHGHSPCPPDKMYEKRGGDGKLVAVNLDAGCCYGMPWSALRALNIDTDEIVEQASLE